MKTLRKNYAHQGLSGIGGLGKVTQDEIANTLVSVRRIIEQAKQEKKYKVGDLLTFDDIDRIYNVGISTAEKVAWVWYKRSMGVDMTGWEKYFLSRKREGSNELLVTDRETMIRDNHFREIGTVPVGISIGRPTKFQNEYDGKTWLVFVAEDGGRRYVQENDVTVKRIGVSAAETLLVDLARKGALFYLNGQFLPYPIYAFGNMYDRELQLKVDEQYIREELGNSVYDAQMDIIQRNKPRMISIQNPDPNERPRIMSVSIFARKRKDFVIYDLREDADVELQTIAEEESRKANYGRGQKNQDRADEFRRRRSNEGKVAFSLTDAFTVWLGSLHKSNFANVTADDIIYYYLDARNFSKETEPDVRATIEMFGPIEGEALFSRFLNEALLFEDQQKLDFYWNRIYNGFSSVPHARVPVGFSCSAIFKTGTLSFTPAQREAIAFMEIANSGIIAYDVGVGKTMSAIITLANAMQSGKCRRPLIVVPNPTYEKWIREIEGYENKKGQYISGVLSGLKVPINRFYNLGVKTKVNLEKAVDADTITVMTYEGFVQLGFSRKLFNEHFDEIAKILSQNDDETASKRDLEKLFEKYRSLLGRGNKNSIADIDILGFDYLVIDEAHNFKNIFDQVPTDEDNNRRYTIAGNTSDRALKAFFHTNYIQRKYKGNVMLLTATPFTNSPLEIYSMLGMVGYNDMVKMGLNNLQAFMSTFVLQSMEYANNYDGGIVLKNVVKSYQNRLVLQSLIHNKIAYKTGEEAGVKRPVKLNIPRLKEVRNGKVVRVPKEDQILSYLAMNPIQRAYQDDIVRDAQNAKSLGEVGRAMNKSLDNALSPYLVSDKSKAANITPKEYVEGSPKIHYAVECIRSVKKWHEDRKQTCSGQVIYMNRGKDFFGHIKRYLEESVGFVKGVRHNGKRMDEVEIISSGISNEAKESIKDAFLEGVVKVIIGTATIREGIDLQKRGSVLYNLYPDWNPTDIKQLEGRIYRQGNDFGFVRVVMPLVQDTMDIFVFQKLDEKSSRINDIWYRSDRGNVLDQESLDPEEIKFHLYTDIEKLVDVKIDQSDREFQRQQNVVENQYDVLQKFKASVTTHGFYKKKVLAKFSNWVEQIQYDLTPRYESETKYALAERKYSNLTVNIPEQKARYAFVDRLLERALEIRDFQTSSTLDDKEMFRLANQVDQDYKKMYKSYQSFFYSELSECKSAYSIMLKGERTVLAPRGYSMSDNIDEIIATLKVEYVKIGGERDFLKSSSNRLVLADQIRKKKAELAVEGGNAVDVAAKFAAYNYLLAYGADEVNADSTIPRNRGFAITMGDYQAPANQKSDASGVDREREKAKLKFKIQIAAAVVKIKIKLSRQAA